MPIPFSTTFGTLPTEVDGYQAVKLWWRYVESFDLEALNTLLEYNREDVINLKAVKEMLVGGQDKSGITEYD